MNLSPSRSLLKALIIETVEREETHIVALTWRSRLRIVAWQLINAQRGQGKGKRIKFDKHLSMLLGTSVCR